jgi:O-antigen/teichoic acid export membrane protein
MYLPASLYGVIPSLSTASITAVSSIEAKAAPILWTFMSQFESWKAFLTPKLHRVIEFFASQGITVAGNLFYGFLCVRLLPITEYAKFAVVFGSLGTLSVLMDVSFSATLIPLIGERVDDRQLIADYVASLRQLAQWIYFAVAPAAIIAFSLIVHRQHWSLRVVVFMVAILLLASWCSRVNSAYGAVLILRRDRKPWYRAQMISSLGTLALLGAAWATHLLSAALAISLNVAGIVFVAASYFFRARRVLGVKGRPSKEKRREIIHLALPNLPNVIFYAFQGQLSLLLITIFGRSTAVASVGALSRLSQIYVLFGQMGPLLILPYFARLPVARLKRNYVGVAAATALFCLLVVGAARVYPQIFLWVLGHNYTNLRFEVLLIIASSSTNFLCDVLWVMASARRFVYWWNGAAFITLTLAVQILFIWKADLSTVRSVLTMGLCAAGVNVVVVLLTGIYGFVYGPRRAAALAPAVVEGNCVRP